MIQPLAAILVFPLVALVLFRAMPLRAALIWTVLVGYLFLPSRTELNLPLLPSINKDTMPALSALIFAPLLALREPAAVPQPGWLPRSPWIIGLILLTLAGGFMTALTNQDQLIFGSVVLPALQLYDGFSSALSSIFIFLPMLLIDLLVSALLMALGMMMMPPTMVSLPIKLGIFVLADGWHLVVGSLAGSFS